MATKIIFHTFINSFYNENIISIDTFDEYIKNDVAKTAEAARLLGERYTAS